MIVDLRLPPGSPVDEQSLAAEVGLGRMPVREAMARLAGDHLVVIMPRRGMIISPIGLDSVREIFEAREAIECGTSYWASRHATGEELVVLRRLINEADDAREEADFARFLDDDQRIHRLLAHAAHNTFLEQAADRLLVHNLRFWRFFAVSHPGATDSMMTHRPLLAALEQRDADAAHVAMRAHIHAARAQLNALF
jgi:DNA-binding GntR family transcriptional regulator